ncbi:hypothetical protein PV325_001945 [Microctonus aethiopoides]|nr:hypothetical protein PV325_001945 [Microctonus aethiopoides]
MESNDDINTTMITQQGDWVESAIIAMQTYYIPSLVSLGTLGNCLSVYIFFMTKMRRASSSWYLSALAISDTGFLISLLIAWLNLVGISIFNRPGYCQFFIYLPTLCSFLSVWFVVSFTVERFVAVRYPLRRQSMCTVTRAKAILIILTIIGIIICSPVLWFSSTRPTNRVNNITSCILAEEWKDWARIFNIVDTILTFVLPFTAIVVLNSLIIKTVWRFAGVRRTLTTINSSRDRKSKRSEQSSGISQTKVTKMLLVKNEDPPHAILITQQICDLLFDTTFGINFVLYCASGQNFRNAVIAIIVRSPRRWHSSTPISNHGNQFGNSI